MRRMIKTCLLILVVLVSLNAKASDILSVKVGNASTIHVSLQNALKGQKLYLKNYSGNVIFNMTLTEDKSYQKTFDLALLTDGIYFVETETAFDIKVTPVVKNSKGVALINESVNVIFKPTVKEEKGMIHVLLNNIEKSPVILSVYDNEGVLLHTERISDKEYIIKRTYNFTKVPSGEYSLYFRLRDRVFTETVSI